MRAGGHGLFLPKPPSSRSSLISGAGPGSQTLTQEAPRQSPAGLEAQGFAEGLLWPGSLLGGHVGVEGTWGLPSTRPSPVTLQTLPPTHTPSVGRLCTAPFSWPYSGSGGRGEGTRAGTGIPGRTWKPRFQRALPLASFPCTWVVTTGTGTGAACDAAAAAAAVGVCGVGSRGRRRQREGGDLWSPDPSALDVRPGGPSMDSLTESSPDSVCE